MQINQRACLLSWVGSETYELLTKLYGHEDITSKTLKELSDKLSTHFAEKKHVQAARYDFYNCKMKPDQSYSDWAADFRGIARNCNFTCKGEGCGKSYVDKQIRDVIIKETPHADIRRQCLLESDPSLDDILKKAATYITTPQRQTEFSRVKVVSQPLIKCLPLTRVDTPSPLINHHRQVGQLLIKPGKQN